MADLSPAKSATKQSTGLNIDSKEYKAPTSLPEGFDKLSTHSDPLQPVSLVEEPPVKKPTKKKNKRSNKARKGKGNNNPFLIDPMIQNELMPITQMFARSESQGQDFMSNPQVQDLFQKFNE